MRTDRSEVLLLRITSLDGIPDDPAEFEPYDRSVHTPAVRRIPEVCTVRFGRILEPADAGLAPYDLESDVSVDERASLGVAFPSAETDRWACRRAARRERWVTISLCNDEDFPPLAP
jgi:hypothetical protein